MEEGNKEDDVNLDEIEMPPKILVEILAGSRKRKAERSDDGRPCKTHCGQVSTAEGFVNISGDPAQRLESTATRHSGKRIATDTGWGYKQQISSRWITSLN
ncbi:hypothetical protein BX600DRAFT_440130 [Xylariales sp. PMI_506]|nr:hypothetical protein BX600DRAFT_440130 [Xylariales sp. PMI_506]